MHVTHRRGLWILAGFLTSLLCASSLAEAQEWKGRVRGSWVREGEPQAGDVALVEPGKVCQIVVADGAHSAVKQAATFLGEDIEKLTGAKAEIVATPTAGAVAIRLVTLGEGAQLPDGVAQDKLKGQWESYQVLSMPDAVWLVGSDARGTAFAAYTLAERLGIDPLHLWTGYTPERRERLVLKKTDHFVASPTVKYRGLFHDDEDILPRPFEYNSGYPLRIGDVPLEWYKKFFETALRLRMNMVAPYTRVHRRFEVQKTASDWGLFYTSHHYDILLSNPFGFNRFKLAERRGVTGDWNWLTNRQNMIKYWRGGVEENGALDCIWPVGLRGTDDYGYPFPKDMSEAEQNKIFQDVIAAQIEVTRKNVPEAKPPPVFHFTLYGEMLDKYLAGTRGGGTFDMPEDVILIWPDDNDGRMRALPTDKGKWKHGVYYHLAYWGPVAKQSMSVVPPKRIAGEFKRIVAAGATEYMLLNVSELREFVMGARMIAEICWDADAALADTKAQPMPDHLLAHVPTAATQPLPPDVPAPSADRYVEWWCREYFGDAAAKDAAEAYRLYYDLIDKWDMQWWAGDRVPAALDSLMKKFAGQEFAPANPQTLPTLQERHDRYQKAYKVLDRARSKMDRAQRQFFFENCELPIRITGRHTESALLLVQAMSANDRDKAWALCEQAMAPLEQLEIEILRAERPPFVKWYRDTFIRHEHTGLNPHKPYYYLRAFLSSGGTEKAHLPEGALRPNLEQFLPILLKEE
ncbi:MAG TPA: glycosyl hydrolase 115 family protein [Tepidisphaeraceae bacterium]|nr:glycosyl hydrolase 115 family protein [Tepidisphaeraceae bacterium]